MLKIFFTVSLIYCCLAQQYQQEKLPPGVNPQTYQQPPQQQYQPPPPQQQQQYQQPQFQQQPPPQQYQQQQYQQQVPVQPVQGHQGDPNILNPQNINQEREHIQEHMDVPIDTSKMTEQELQFHYFKMHDNDGNNKLDGCELIKSLIHWHEEERHEQKNAPTEENTPVENKPVENENAPVENKPAENTPVENTPVENTPVENAGKIEIYSDEEIINAVDPILNKHDLNGDGYIDYAEYIAGIEQQVKEENEKKSDK